MSRQPGTYAILDKAETNEREDQCDAIQPRAFAELLKIDQIDKLRGSAGISLRRALIPADMAEACANRELRPAIAAQHFRADTSQFRVGWLHRSPILLGDISYSVGHLTSSPCTFNVLDRKAGANPMPS